MVKTHIKGRFAMPSIRIALKTATLKGLHEILRNAEHRGDIRTVKRIHAVIAVGQEYQASVIARILHVC
jgi:hypothetical protein